MTCSITTGLSEMRHADSDSVNLGSNPSPPATEILEKSGDLGAGQVGQDSPEAPDGRTEPGTALPPEIRALVDESRAWIRGKLAEHPGRDDVFHRHRTADHTLDLIAGGDDSPEVFGALSERLAELRRVTASSCTVHARPGQDR
jgi:hypothetical protein